MIHRFEAEDGHASLCDLSRKLLQEGKANRGDRIELLRLGRTALSGSIGWFADHTVSENARGGPRFVKWEPFPVSGVRSETASDVSGVS